MDYQDVRDGRTRPHMPQLIVPYSQRPDDKCCLLVLDSVTSTLQWIRQHKPRVHL